MLASLLLAISLFKVQLCFVHDLLSRPEPNYKTKHVTTAARLYVSTLQVCKAFLATKIYPQKLKSNKSKVPQKFLYE